MTTTEWLIVVGLWGALQATVAALVVKVRRLETNGLKHMRQSIGKIFDKLDDLPCGAHGARLDNLEKTELPPHGRMT